jgi:protein transport protein SEC31
MVNPMIPESTNQVSQEVMLKIGQLVDDLNSRNFVGASATQTDLVNTAWTQHKEWIKGIKVLIQLSSKTR